ncbi:hypothetical protein FOA52_015291 [Chlamydomonas sp. UWO 241]|nr:hypothetical protein FOA52_015291 [Chlamydomonas sp. UWO 241]
MDEPGQDAGLGDAEPQAYYGEPFYISDDMIWQHIAFVLALGAACIALAALGRLRRPGRARSVIASLPPLTRLSHADGGADQRRGGRVWSPDTRGEPLPTWLDHSPASPQGGHQGGGTPAASAPFSHSRIVLGTGSPDGSSAGGGVGGGVSGSGGSRGTRASIVSALESPALSGGGGEGLSPAPSIWTVSKSDVMRRRQGQAAARGQATPTPPLFSLGATDASPGCDGEIAHGGAERLGAAAGLATSRPWRSDARGGALAARAQVSHRLGVYRALRAADPIAFASLLDRPTLTDVESFDAPAALLVLEYVASTLVWATLVWLLALAPLSSSSVSPHAAYPLHTTRAAAWQVLLSSTLDCALLIATLGLGGLYSLGALVMSRDPQRRACFGQRCMRVHRYISHGSAARQRRFACRGGQPRRGRHVQQRCMRVHSVLEVSRQLPACRFPPPASALSGSIPGTPLPAGMGGTGGWGDGGGGGTDLVSEFSWGEMRSGGGRGGGSTGAWCPVLRSPAPPPALHSNGRGSPAHTQSTGARRRSHDAPGGGNGRLSYGLTPGAAWGGGDSSAL